MIADKLQLDAGDTFEIEYKGEIHHFRVSAIYQTGVTDIDSVRVYIKMDDARALFKKPTGATYLQVSLIDKDRAREDAAEMTNSLQYKVGRLAGPREVVARGLQGLPDRDGHHGVASSRSSRAWRCSTRWR